MEIRVDGIYLSTAGLDKYDMTLYWYYLRFYESGQVYKGFTIVEPVKTTQFGVDNYVGAGTYQVLGNQVKCTIKSISDNWISVWNGHIKNDAIEFSIDHPDFEDLDGEYTFIQDNTS